MSLIAVVTTAWLLLPLHGELPAQEQRRVFGKPPRGTRKVILSTNVAETCVGWAPSHSTSPCAALPCAYRVRF